MIKLKFDFDVGLRRKWERGLRSDGWIGCSNMVQTGSHEVTAASSAIMHKSLNDMVENEDEANVAGNASKVTAPSEKGALGVKPGFCNRLYDTHENLIPFLHRDPAAAYLTSLSLLNRETYQIFGRLSIVRLLGIIGPKCYFTPNEKWDQARTTKSREYVRATK